MSKANSAIKVLRTALKRVNKGWTKSTWHHYDGIENKVCLEGAIYGYCDQSKHQTTSAQREAINVVKQIIHERTNGEISSIPEFNDATFTDLEDIQEVIKLGIVRLETGGEIEDEELEELLDWREVNQK